MDEHTKNEVLERALERRLGHLAKRWAAVPVPDKLNATILTAIRAEPVPARNNARTLLQMLAANRDLLAQILAAPGRTLPAFLERFSTSLNDFSAELQRMKEAYSDSGNRELHDDELIGVVGGVPSGCLSMSDINQLLRQLGNIKND